MTNAQNSFDLNNFVLDRKEQNKVQTYIEVGIAMPATKADMKLKLESILKGVNNTASVTDEEASQFTQLIGNYKLVKEHCSNFKTRIYPKSVQMADNLAHYGGIAHTTYQDILNTAYDWLDGKLTATEAKAELKDFAGSLKITAESYARHVAEVKGDITQFLLDTQQDKLSLDATKAQYDTRFNLQDSSIQELRKRIDAINGKIKNLQDEYEKAKNVAATTPTYLAPLVVFPWLWVPALIAIPVVAGIYGKNATDLLSQIEGERQKLASQTEKIQKAIALKAILEAGNTSLSGILTKLQEALPVLDKIKDLWNALAQESTKIPEVIEANIIKGDLVQIDTAYQDLISRWKTLSIAAGQYRNSAYIKIVDVDLEKIKQNPDAYLDVDASKLNWEANP